ncbi:MAG: GIY-YIG nuclease family protein [Candidatus Hydrogenedentes bacterium]|nr:GIY-YIG nuclease family protein [Candidatus Hydrogenedentota bacterium]
MFNFNALLEEAGLNPDQVQLVRHRDTGRKLIETPYDLWVASDGRFQTYHSFQSKKRFKIGGFTATFVVSPAGDTLFAGMYKAETVKRAPKGTTCPCTGIKAESGTYFLYRMTKVCAFEKYEGLLTVDWGRGFRNWIQRAKNQNKRILELRRVFQEPDFPGFSSFSTELGRLAGLPHSWKAVLSSVRGVYLLVCVETGKQYVGSAVGTDGFLGRWQDYAANGHGGNVELKKHKTSGYRASVLEVASPTATHEEIIATENFWKQKLLTQEFGLNKN